MAGARDAAIHPAQDSPPKQRIIQPNMSTVKFFVAGGCPGPYRVFNSIPGLCTPEVSSIPHSGDKEKTSLDIGKCSLGDKVHSPMTPLRSAAPEEEEFPSWF